MPKALVILTPGFPASHEDSTCLPMQQQFIKSLKKLYPQVHIIVLSFQYPYEVKNYQWFGIEIMSFGGKNKGGLSRLWLRRKVLAALAKLQQQHHIIGLLSFWYGECAAVGKIFSRRYQCKHFCWMLGQDAKDQNPYLHRMPPRASELIALSHFLQDEVEKNCRVKPQWVIPPGLDASLFSNDFSFRDIDVLAVGSLISLKKFPLFLQLIHALKKHFPYIKAVLGGSGPEMANLQKMISRLSLEKEVILLGELPYQEVLQLMQRTKVFVHPSSYEGFSGVCMEALTAGAEVVSFCKPMRDDIEHWQIAASKEDMLQKIISILRNENVEYKTRNMFPVERTAKEMMALFSGTLV